MRTLETGERLTLFERMLTPPLEAMLSSLVLWYQWMWVAAFRWPVKMQVRLRTDPCLT